MSEPAWLAALVVTGVLGLVAWVQRERWIHRRRSRGRGATGASGAARRTARRR